MGPIEKLPNVKMWPRCFPKSARKARKLESNDGALVKRSAATMPTEMKMATTTTTTTPTSKYDHAEFPFATSVQTDTACVSSHRGSKMYDANVECAHLLAR